MADIVLTSNTTRSSLTIDSSDNLYLNGFILTLDGNLACANIHGGSPSTPIGSGRIAVPTGSYEIVCSSIGNYNSTTAPMLSLSNGIGLILTTTNFNSATQLVNVSSEIINLTIRTPTDDYNTVLTCPQPPVAFNSTFINVPNSSTLTLRGIFRGQQSSTSSRYFISTGISTTVSITGCLIGGVSSSNPLNVCFSTGGAGFTLSAFSTGSYAGVALAGGGTYSVWHQTNAPNNEVVINGSVYGSNSTATITLFLEAAYQSVVINGNVYGGVHPTTGSSGQAVSLSSSMAFRINGTAYGGKAYAVYVLNTTNFSFTLDSQSGDAVINNYLQCLYFAPYSNSTFVINGNIRCVSSYTSYHSLLWNPSQASNTLTINGDITTESGVSNSVFALSVSSTGNIVVNGRIIATNSPSSAVVNVSTFFGNLTVNYPSGDAVVGGSASGAVALSISQGSLSTGNVNIYGNVVGGSAANAAGIRVGYGQCTVTIVGNVVAGSAAPAITSETSTSGLHQFFCKRNVISGNVSAIVINAPQMDFYFEQDLIKGGSAYVLQNSITTLPRSFCCTAIGIVFKDTSNNVLPIQDAVNWNQLYPNDGYGWVINAKLQNAADFLNAVKELPYGHFIIDADISASTTNHSPTTFYGYLGAVGFGVPYKITYLSLGSLNLFHAISSGAKLENLEFSNISGGSPFLATNNYGTIQRCYIKSGSSASFVYINIGTITECYNRRGGIVDSNNSGVVSKCFHSNPASQIGQYLDDQQAVYKNSYAGWDFYRIWDIQNGVDTPFLNFRNYSGIFSTNKPLSMSNLLGNSLLTDIKET